MIKSNYLIKQALLLPLYFFVPITLAGLLTLDYSSISQHASEITLRPFSLAILVFNMGEIATGLSILLLALGISLKFGSRLVMTVVVLSFYGTSLMTNGLYPMGDPMHGFYGIGLSFMVLPFISNYELKGSVISKRFFKITSIVGILVFIGFWLLLIELDPEAYRGLSQRIKALIGLGWIAYLAYSLTKLDFQK